MSVQAMSWVLEESRSKGTARLVLLAIANHIDKYDGRGWCFTKQIQREANVSRASYHRAVNDLIELGELTRQFNTGGRPEYSDDRRPNMFSMPMFVSAGRGAQDETGSQSEHGGGAQDAHPAGYSDCAPITVPGKPSVEPSHSLCKFDEWWAIYPKKVGKGAARVEWEAATAKTSPDCLLDSLRSHLAAFAEVDRQYVPNPAKWLRDERWTDELDEAPVGHLPEPDCPTCEGYGWLQDEGGAAYRCECWKLAA